MDISQSPSVILQMDVLTQMYQRNYWTMAAFILLIMDYLLTFLDEVKYIWKRPFTLGRCTFLFSRYCSLIGQGVNCYILINIISPTSIPIKIQVCHRWYFFQLVLFWLLFLAGDLVLLLRVTALYNCHRLIRLALVLLLVFETTLATVCGYRTVLKADFNSGCKLVGFPTREVSIFCIGILISQVAIWAMTLVGKRRIRPNSIDDRSFLLSIIMRDGIWMFFIIIALFLMVYTYSSIRNKSDSHILFALPTSLIALMTCRHLLNLHHAHFRGPKLREFECDGLEHSHEDRSTALENPLDTHIESDLWSIELHPVSNVVSNEESIDIES